MFKKQLTLLAMSLTQPWHLFNPLHVHVWAQICARNVYSLTATCMSANLRPIRVSIYYAYNTVSF